jgi:molecular chaperone GrpE (heat shock protein)
VKPEQLGEAGDSAVLQQEAGEWGRAMNPLIQVLGAELGGIESLLDNELQEAAERIAIREKNARFLEIILETPEMPPRELNARLSAEFGPGSRGDVLQQFRDSKINTPQERLRVVEVMRSTASSLLRMLDGTSPELSKDYDKVAKIVLSRVFKERRVEGKLLLMAICRSRNADSADSIGEASLFVSRLGSVATQGSYKLCREAARRIVYALGQFYGLAKRQTTREKVEAILEDMEISRDVDDLRATLFIVQRELSELKDGFEAEFKDATSNYVQNFFSALNSPQSSHLLDTVAQTQQLIREQSSKGWDIPSELRVIPMVLDVFLNALRSYGLEPIEQVGGVKEVSHKALSEYEFMGSQYPTSPRVRIVIRTPGWRVGSKVISKPRAQEMGEA